MAVAACGRALDVRRAAMEATAQRDDNLARMARTVGKPPVQTAAACAAGRHAVVIDAIEAVRDDTRRCGGIHAPPDMLALTLIDSALRRQDTVRTRRRLAERRVHESEASRSGTRLEVCAGPAA